ncbi:hypothetical protein STEG23_007396 [Scotinomys teguina]
MPRGNKSKSRSRARRQQARGESQNLQEAKPTTEKEAPCPPLGQGDAPCSPNVCTPQSFQGAVSHGSTELNVSHSVSDVSAEGSVAGIDVKLKNACIIAAAIDSKHRDPLYREASKILYYLLEKYQNDEQPMKADMLRLIKSKYKVHFPCILEKATYQLEIVYGLELKIDHTCSYVLVNKLPIPPGAKQGGKKELPKTGLILSLLGMIMMECKHATEEEVWRFFHMQGIYPGRRHLIIGEPRRFITKELVEQNYVEYRQVPGSDPPTYEFLWGSRAHNKTIKRMVLDVLDKMKNGMPVFYPQQYEEALRNQAERAARRGHHGARIPSHAQSSSSSYT